MKYLKPLGVLGLLGGSLAIVSIATTGDTFGFPGSAEYVSYEIFNRSMGFLLALQTCSLIAFFIGRHQDLERFDRRLLAIAIIAWASMAIGTAAEFWLYSDLPYPRTPADFNMRVAAYALFFFGSLVAGGVLLTLAVRLRKREMISTWLAVVLVLYFPVFFLGLSIFLPSALSSIAIATSALAKNRKSVVLDEKSA